MKISPTLDDGDLQYREGADGKGEGKMKDQEGGMKYDGGCGDPNCELCKEDAKAAGAVCSDCPPVGYPSDKTRCAECPRSGALSLAEAQREMVTDWFAVYETLYGTAE